MKYDTYSYKCTDCETCFTIFYKQTSPAPSKNYGDRTTNDVRVSIYEFQQQIDAKDSLSGNLSGNGPEHTHVQSIGNFSDFDFDRNDEDDSAQSKKIDRNKVVGKKVGAQSPEHSPNTEKRSLFGRWSRKALLTSPKTPRPQLQAFF